MKAGSEYHSCRNEKESLLFSLLFSILYKFINTNQVGWFYLENAATREIGSYELVLEQLDRFETSIFSLRLSKSR